jgi:hypothetical protein
MLRPIKGDVEEALHCSMHRDKGIVAGVRLRIADISMISMIRSRIAATRRSSTASGGISLLVLREMVLSVMMMPHFVDVVDDAVKLVVAVLVVLLPITSAGVTSSLLS